jgi:hypothetical protein
VLVGAELDSTGATGVGITVEVETGTAIEVTDGVVRFLVLDLHTDFLVDAGIGVVPFVNGGVPADGAGVTTGTAELEGLSGIGVPAAEVVAEADEAGAEVLDPDSPGLKSAGPGTVYVVVPLYGSKKIPASVRLYKAVAATPAGFSVPEPVISRLKHCG